MVEKDVLHSALNLLHGLFVDRILSVDDIAAQNLLWNNTPFGLEFAIQVRMSQRTSRREVN